MMIGYSIQYYFKPCRPARPPVFYTINSDYSSCLLCPIDRDPTDILFVCITLLILQAANSMPASAPSFKPLHHLDW